MSEFAIDVSCKTVGFEAFAKDLARHVEDVEAMAKEVLKDSADELVANASRNAPVRTGALKASIKPGKLKGSGSHMFIRPYIDYPKTARYSIVTGKKNEQKAHYYAFAMEYGWHDRKGNFHQGHPFWTPAKEELKRKFPDKFAKRYEELKQERLNHDYTK